MGTSAELDRCGSCGQLAETGFYLEANTGAVTCLPCGKAQGLKPMLRDSCDDISAGLHVEPADGGTGYAG